MWGRPANPAPLHTLQKKAHSMLKKQAAQPPACKRPPQSAENSAFVPDLAPASRTYLFRCSDSSPPQHRPRPRPARCLPVSRYRFPCLRARDGHAFRVSSSPASQYAREPGQVNERHPFLGVRFAVNLGPDSTVTGPPFQVRGWATLPNPTHRTRVPFGILKSTPEKGGLCVLIPAVNQEAKPARGSARDLGACL